MYVSKHHRLEDRDSLFALIESNPLGAWVCSAADGLQANHVPFYLDRGKGPFGTLIGHVARANPVWRALEQGSGPSVVMFRGPQAYITPGWYPGKTAHGKVVPTWNYTVAHAHGVARAIADRDWLRAMLERLTGAQEAGQAEPWRLDDAPADYFDKLLRAIVGIEVPIERLEGKLKASQDEDLADRIGTVAGLEQRSCDEARAIAALVGAAIEAEARER